MKKAPFAERKVFYSLKRKWKQGACTNKATMLNFLLCKIYHCLMSKLMLFFFLVNYGILRLVFMTCLTTLSQVCIFKDITAAETLIISGGCTGQNKTTRWFFKWLLSVIHIFPIKAGH